MFDLIKLVRKNILELVPYSSARTEYTGDEGIFLDANENPYGTWNRYPDPYQKKLKEKIATLKAIDENMIFLGNGSDEIIDLIIRVFCNPGVDKVLTFTPTYGMYDVAAAINDVSMIELPLDESFQIDLASVQPYLKDKNLKVIFICSPNNPTGNCIADIEILLKRFNGIIVVDEAYIDFTSTPSYTSKLKEYQNLIVVQTLSKAWAMAALRIGIAYADKNVTALLNKVKPPYNISKANQDKALELLTDTAAYNSCIKVVQEEKEKLIAYMETLPFIVKVYPSDANFILVETTDADRIYRLLVANNIIVRNRNKVIPDCIRISIGTPQENAALMTTLKTSFT